MQVYLAKPPPRNAPCARRVSGCTTQRRQRNKHRPATCSYRILNPVLAALSGHSFKTVKLGPKLICRRDTMWSCICCDPGVGTFLMIPSILPVKLSRNDKCYHPQ